MIFVLRLDNLSDCFRLFARREGVTIKLYKSLNLLVDYRFKTLVLCMETIHKFVLLKISF